MTSRLVGQGEGLREQGRLGRLRTSQGGRVKRAGEVRKVKDRSGGKV